jgi:hypothetical protein
MQRLSRRLSIALLCSSLLAACGGMPGLAPDHAADFDACQSDADKAPKVDSFRKRLDFIDRCMASKGWTPTAGCKYQENEGTKFCEYAR